MFKTKKSKFIVITILTIVGLLCLIPLIQMMDYFSGISSIKNQTIDSDIDVSVTMNVEFRSYTENWVLYFYYVGFDFTFNASVTAVEIVKVECNIYHNTENIFNYYSKNGGWFRQSVVLFGQSIVLIFGDNLTCQGSVDINYQLNSNPQNGTVNYNLVYTHSVRENDAYSFMLFEGTVNIAHFISFFLLPLILYFTIHPDFYEPSKEEKEKNEEFFDNLAKGSQEKRNKSITKN